MPFKIVILSNVVYHNNKKTTGPNKTASVDSYLDSRRMEVSKSSKDRRIGDL